MAIVLGVAACTCAAAVGPWCAISPDSVAYLEVARSLWTTGAFPAERLIRPPGYSVLMAPLLGSSDLPELSLRWLAAACWIGSSLLAVRLARIELGGVASAAVGIGVATHALLLTQSAFVLTELPFMPLMLASLLVAAEGRHGEGPSHRRVVVAGLLAGAAGLVRSVGLVLGPAIALSLLFRREWNVRRRTAAAAIFLLVVALPHAAWSLRQARYPKLYGYDTIWTQARPIENTAATGLDLQWRRFLAYGPLRLSEMRTALIGDKVAWRLHRGDLGRATGWLVGGLAAAVVFGFLVQRRSAVDFFVAGTVGVLALWPWDEGPRFVAPLVPLLLVYCALAVRAAWTRWAGVRGVRWVIGAGVTAFAALHAAEFAATMGRLPAQSRKAEQRVAEMRKLADWLGRDGAGRPSVTAVTRPGDDARTLIAGGAYLAHRRLHSMIETESLHSEDLPGAPGLLVIQSSLAKGDSGPSIRPLATVGELIVAKPSPRDYR
jgi:hypothetical protein